MLRIRLFGHLQAFQDDTGLDVLLAPRTALVWAYLLLHPSAALPRSEVAFALWPDLPEADALQNLRRQLHLLGRHLPTPPPDRPWILADRLTVGWNPAADHWLDVAEFEAACRAADAGGAALGALRRAAEQYRAELLAGCYEDWILVRRERLGEGLVRILEQLAARQAGHDWRASVAAAERLVAHDPLRETSHRLAMGLRYLAGDRPAALRQHAACERLLRDELGVAPMPATTRLRDAIEDGRPAGEVAALLGPDLPLGVDLVTVPARRVAHNLPSSLTSFVGRESAIAEVVELVGTVRLVTLTGPGGSGKTRLALECARALLEMTDQVPNGTGAVPAPAPAPPLRHGIWLVELGALDDPALVGQAVAGVLGLPEEPLRPLAASLSEALASREMLLVLDGCEHLIDACADLAGSLLAAVPALRILVTSREPLGVPGEVRWLVGPLTVPPAGGATVLAELARSEAARLFVERASTGRPAFTLTAENAGAVALICRRLDGIPLALELAAARARVLPLPELAARLDDALPLLDAGRRAGPPRQRTLRATLDWSYALLAAPERDLFVRLAPFAGAFALEAAEAVGGKRPGTVLVGLMRLVDKSLVQVEHHRDQARYRLLETVRQYARQRLAERAAGDDAYERHAAYFLAVAEAAEPRLSGPGQAAWLDRLESEHDDLRSALQWSCESGAAETGVRLAGALGPFWQARGHLREGLGWIERTLSLPGAESLGAVRAKALRHAGALAARLADPVAARAALEESTAICRRLDDAWGLAASLNALGNVAFVQTDCAGARALFEESLDMARRYGWRHREGVQLGNCAFVLWHIGEHEAALARAEEALLVARQEGDPSEEARAHINAGRALCFLDRPVEAEARLRRAVALCRRARSPYLLTNALCYLAEARLADGSDEALREATALADEAVRVARRVHLAHAVVRGLSLGAQTLLAMGDVENAVERSDRAVALLETSGPLEVPREEVLFRHWAILAATGRPEAGRPYLVAAFEAVAAKADGFRDPARRRTFLERVPVNRRIAAAMEALRPADEGHAVLDDQRGG